MSDKGKERLADVYQLSNETDRLICALAQALAKNFPVESAALLRVLKDEK